MTTPQVSVCIATHNQARYICDCIMSVISQNHAVELEIVVGDDQSTDGTSTIVQELASTYPKLIRHVYHESRLGRGCLNYQHLFALARGKYIAPLDGDDFWLPGKLVAQVRFLEAHPECPAVYTNALCIREDGTPFGFFNNPQPAFLDMGDLVRRGNFLNYSSMLYRSSLKSEILTLHAPFLDYRIHIQLAHHSAIGYLNRTLTAYRISSGTSVLIHANNLVRELYWEALKDVPRDKVHSDDLGQGMAEFMRSVFYRAIRTRSLALVKEWWPRVLAEAPIGRTRMLAWVSWSIVRVGLIESISAICRGVTGNPAKVLYRR